MSQGILRIRWLAAVLAVVTALAAEPFFAAVFFK